ncbi:MAG: hypothetical protein KJ558_08015 [Gammaproteobacteria bacterium]|nr:hypothetical protein [Gammaproteobacteria bacterium]MBU1654759.1 hypothetical protein [Gammaproteobacteria bacterium]MBU1961634.1 hypothetical protein [Gammaproteobacteria bacterium]
MTSNLDAGERSAISLAFETGLGLLIEEKEGRQIASRIGLSFSGIAGQIARAHRLNVICRTEALSLYAGLYRSHRIHLELYLRLVEDLDKPW